VATPDAIERARATLRQQVQDDEASTALMTDGQRRLVLAMAAAGLGWLLVGLLAPPRGALFWACFAVVPPLLAAIAALLGGRRGIDAWLLGARQSFAPTLPAVLPVPARDALRIAAVTPLLAELARASTGMPASEKAAAGLLIEAATRAWNTAPDDAARLALARALPALVAGLRAGGAEAIRAADAFAAAAGGAR
jgi:hypothetical protein